MQVAKRFYPIEIRAGASRHTFERHSSGITQGFHQSPAHLPGNRFHQRYP